MPCAEWDRIPDAPSWIGFQTPCAEWDRILDSHRRVGFDPRCPSPSGIGSHSWTVHIDETNDGSCCALLPMAAALRSAREAGYKGAVLLGHCTSLAVQPPERQAAVLDALPELGDVSIVANPFTNLGLMDRRGTAPPVGALVEAATPRTPLWRGLTLVQELHARGVNIAAASDNVRDHWHPYGDYDPLSVWHAALTMGHLTTAPNEGAWAGLCTDAAAAAMGITPAGGSCVAAGSRADLVIFPSASRMSELLSRPQADRVVLRGGKPQARSPEHSPPCGAPTLPTQCTQHTRKHAHASTHTQARTRKHAHTHKHAHAHASTSCSSPTIYSTSTFISTHTQAHTQARTRTRHHLLFFPHHLLHLHLHLHHHHVTLPQQVSSLPRFGQLDDLVHTPTAKAVAGSGNVQRGATVVCGP
mgnify:CR=1 FL=1